MILNAMFFFVTFIYIFLKSFQQLNVMWKKYWWVPPISYGMALCECLLWIKVVEVGLGWGVFWIGTGGAIGCMCAMYSHKKLEKFFNDQKG